MIQNTEKSKEVLKAEQALAQAKARLEQAKRKESVKKRESENRHKYMMGVLSINIFQSAMTMTSRS